MRLFYKVIFLLLFSIMLSIPSLRAQDALPAFEDKAPPTAPDYSKLYNWAAHPQKEDLADRVPRPLKGQQSPYHNEVDIFFLHPTIFTGKVKGKYWWNGDLQDKKLNQKADKTSIRYQASVFNGAGRIYAPRYRQAHLRSFYSPYTEDGDKALALAYEDVKKAFLYYLENNNKGRPFILAGHSQGARHLKQLLKELFDGQELTEQLIAAYVVGWGVEADTYEALPLGTHPSQTGCILTWRTYRRGFRPSWIRSDEWCVNPLTWRADGEHAPYSMNEGAVLYAFNMLRHGILDAQVVDGVVWVGEPNYWLKAFLKRDNYHSGDYNLFYTNIRNNAIERVSVYMKARE